MITYNTIICPICGDPLVYYDSVNRVLIRKGGLKYTITMRRLKCITCHKIHRELTEDILPFKHYESEIVKGVIEGYITSNTIGFEDYPSEMTMQRWKSQNLQLLL